MSTRRRSPRVSQRNSFFEPLEPRQMLAGELRPTAALYAPPISQWGSTYVLKVTYSDDTGVNAATLGDNDVQIIGPNGFSRSAKFYRRSSASNQKVVSAWYKISAPAGVWDAPDNGWYQVRLNTAQVRDINGNSARATKVGSVQSTIAAYPSTLVGGVLPSTLLGTDVTTFGAIPNDGIDDTSAIQNAIDSLPRDGDGVPDAEHPLGGIISLPKGTFNTSGPLRLGPAVRLRGQGHDTIILNTSTDSGSSTIELVPWGESGFNIRAGIENLSLISTASKGIWAVPTHGDLLALSLVDLKISTGGAAIDLRNVRTYSAEMRNIVVENPGSTALWLGKENDWVSNVNRIRNFTVRGTARPGFGPELAMVVITGDATVDGLSIAETGAAVLPLYVRGSSSSMRNVSILAGGQSSGGVIARFEQCLSVDLDALGDLRGDRRIEVLDSYDVRIERLSLPGGVRLTDAITTDERSHVTVGTLTGTEDAGGYSAQRFVVRNRGTPATAPAAVPTVVDPQRPQSPRIVDVATFGAFPNDGIDDTVAIQQAVDSLVKAGGGMVAGGTVLLDYGRFNTSSSINLPSGVWLRGRGNGTVIYNTSNNTSIGAIEFVPDTAGYNVGAAVVDVSIYTSAGMGIRANPGITAGLVDMRIDAVLVSAGFRAIDLGSVRTYHSTIQNVFVSIPGSTALILGDVDGYSADNQVIGLQMYGSQRPTFKAEEALVMLRGEYYVQNLWIEHPWHARVLPLLASGTAHFRGLWLEYPGANLPGGVVARFENIIRADIDRMSHVSANQKLKLVNARDVRINMLNIEGNNTPLASTVSVDQYSRLNIGMVAAIMDSGMFENSRVYVASAHNLRDRAVVQNVEPAPDRNLLVNPGFGGFSGTGDDRGEGIAAVPPGWDIRWGDDLGTVEGNVTVVDGPRGPRLKIEVFSNPNNRPVEVRGGLNVADWLIGQPAIARWRIDGAQALLYTAGLGTEYSARAMNGVTSAVVPNGLQGNDQIVFLLPGATGTYYISQVSVALL